MSSTPMMVIGIVTSMVLLAMATISYMGRTFGARSHPVAKPDVSDPEAQLEDDRLCKAAEAAAENKAREEAEQIAPLALHELQKSTNEELEKPLDSARSSRRPPDSARSKASSESSRSRTSSERRRRPVYDDNTRAFQLAQQEQQERKSQEESDRVLRQEKPEQKPDAAEQPASGCGPFKCKACASKRGASEPAARRARK